jgi:hypothetical protein
VVSLTGVLLAALFLCAVIILKQRIDIAQYKSGVIEVYEHSCRLHKRVEQLEYEQDALIKANHELAFAPRAFGEVRDIRA